MVRLDLDPGPLRAYEMVMGFAARRGEAATRLAMHAAVPLVLRVELLHLIRLNFLPEAAHDLAIEADVLFASYCEDMGNGYFCFASNARLQLLQGLDPAYPDESVPRSAQVARFMLDYLDHKQRNVGTARDRLRSQWIEVERWNALAFAEPELAAGQFAAVLARATAKDDVAARLRVGGLSTALATPLARFGELLVYAEGIDAVQMGRTDDADRLFGSMPDREIEIAGIRLKSPRQVLTGYIGKEAPGVQLAESAEQEEARSEVPAEQAQTDETPLEHPKPAHDQIYISYSHRDQRWRDRLVIFLRPYVRDLSIQFADVEESSGKRLEEQEASALERAGLAIVLVNPNYLVDQI